MSTDHEQVLLAASVRRIVAIGELEASLAAMYAAVRSARAGGMSAIRIAEVIGTTRQRVYEILREG